MSHSQNSSYATLETERLTLRMWRESDIDEYASICADPRVMRPMGRGPMDRGEAWRNMAMVIGHWHLRGYGLWAVEERASGALIGRIGCWQPEGWPGFEVGWMLGSNYWGRGFATEAARASLKYAFEELKQTHVISLINPENLPSIRVAERLGEHYEGETEVSGVKLSIYGIEKEA